MSLRRHLLRALLPSTASTPAFASASAAPLEFLQEGAFFAVPKTRKSRSKSRIKFMAKEKQLQNVHHFSPCPGCKEGYLKLSHHLCVCKMREIGMHVRWRDLAQYDVIYRKPSKK